MEVVHRDRIYHYCAMCGFKPAKREDLKSHVEAVHRDGNYHNCVMCGFKAPKRGDLKNHVETVHKDRSLSVTCVTKYSHQIKAGGL